MRKNVRERFEHHSILYVTSILVAANMFIFVMLVFIDQLLKGELLISGILFIAILFMLSVPYWRYKKEGRKIRRLSDMIREDLFLMSFSFTFILVGSVVLLVLIILRARGMV
ncbi:MAG: hypothetical protein ACOCSM_01770 [Bacillota bacterium]